MTAQDLIGNYTYASDLVTLVLCATLATVIKWSLYFLNDRKFTYLKRSTLLISIGAFSNIFFSIVCENHPDWIVAIMASRIAFHVSLLGCLYLFIIYIKSMLRVEGILYIFVSHLTRTIFAVVTLIEITSQFNGCCLQYKDGVWHDPLVNCFTFTYVYSMLVLLLMLVLYGHRMIKTVRYCLIATQVLVVATISISAARNSTTFTTFTFMLPIIVVLMLLHSRPYDENTGAMSDSSFNAYVAREKERGISLDYLVLHLNLNIISEIPSELGKQLSIFWHKFFRSAIFIALSREDYVLVVPRTRENGDTDSKINKLFYEVFPQYYEEYKLQYKIIALKDVDFVESSEDIKGMIHYLTDNMEDNSILIANEAMKEDLRLMQSVRINLIDIEKKGNLNDERVLAYCQPIINLNTGKYDTAEALMRLKLPGYGFITPNKFIPIAEYYGHIHALTMVMLNKVCVEISRLEMEGYILKRVSVNFAVSELRDENFCDEVFSILDRNGVDPSLVGVELTESQNDNDFKIVSEKTALLKEKGMTIYLDDFGTGYSNLDRILKLGLDVIKYDRSLLLAAVDDKNAAYMVQHFAEAFKQFNFKLLFEGVENPIEEKLCLNCGADYLQGFKFSKPIPIEDLRKFLDNTLMCC